jgi:acetyl-CoA carboxylase biotin carboxyl carrier protein
MAAKKSAPAAQKSPELGLVQDLADILAATGLSEIELEQKGIRVRVSKSVTIMASAAPSYAPAPAPPLAPAVQLAPAAPLPPAANPNTVKSPMVGTAYLAPAPGAPDFMEVGAEIKLGQTIVIIEAMKTMNQIPAPRAGRVTQIFVENGNPVEFGQPLCVIE